MLKRERSSSPAWMKDGRETNTHTSPPVITERWMDGLGCSLWLPPVESHAKVDVVCVANRRVYVHRHTSLCTIFIDDVRALVTCTVQALHAVKMGLSPLAQPEARQTFVVVCFIEKSPTNNRMCISSLSLFCRSHPFVLIRLILLAMSSGQQQWRMMERKARTQNTERERERER